MNITQSSGVIYVEITEHNLLTLLAKLQQPDSARTIYKGGVSITAVPDSDHYSDRSAGDVHPDTAKILARERESFIERANKLPEDRCP